MKMKLRVHIPLALITTYFALFFFVFSDLGISMMFAYVAMGFVLIVSVVFSQRVYYSNMPFFSWHLWQYSVF